MSVKKNFLNRSTLDEYEAQDNLLVVKKDYVPGPTAMRVHTSLKKIRILRGGLGSGKTRCGVEHIDEMARSFPGSLHLVARHDITSLNFTTRREYEKILIPETIADFNLHDNVLYYKNGSAVLFRETKDPQKVLSLELSSFMLDETTENKDREIVDKLEQRLRQKVVIDGKKIAPPYAGLCVFNPPSKTHWLFELAQEDNVDDIQFSTYENRHNLPDGYIEDLERRLPPWERRRLLDGDWGIEVRGKPVIWGFGDHHVRPLTINPQLPIIRSWDFGYGHPCCKLYQFDPMAGKKGRLFIFRELLGHKEKLNEFAPRAVEMTKALAMGAVVVDFGDPRGSDNKDVGDSSIDYLRRHHGIHVNHQRQRIKVGIEELQVLVSELAPLENDKTDTAPCLLVDPSCVITIDAYTYGYHKDEEGNPVKDGYFDHGVDTDRYAIVGVRDRAKVMRRPHKKRIPRDRFTGY